MTRKNHRHVVRGWTWIGLCTFALLISGLPSCGGAGQFEACRDNQLGRIRGIAWGRAADRHEKHGCRDPHRVPAQHAVLLSGHLELLVTKQLRRGCPRIVGTPQWGRVRGPPPM